MPRSTAPRRTAIISSRCPRAPRPPPSAYLTTPAYDPTSSWLRRHAAATSTPTHPELLVSVPVTKPAPVAVRLTRLLGPIRHQPASLAPSLRACPPPPRPRMSRRPAVHRAGQHGQPQSESDRLQRQDPAGRAAVHPECRELHTLPGSSFCSPSELRG